jgi:glycosyltransferase involved in cell wall biosynthesis
METNKRLHIVQVSSRDTAGGAERVAYELFQAFASRGHISSLAVGQRRSPAKEIFEIPNDAYRSGWAKICLKTSKVLIPLQGKIRGAYRLHQILLAIGQPRRWTKIMRGHEDFDFPATEHLLNLFETKPDILHCHNLHGGYFDLRKLPYLSQQLPVVLTLHDTWLLSGHCAYSFDCERWKTGCGHCPDLTIYPPVRRDTTAFNWRQKRGVYSKCRLYLAADSHWLMAKVMDSMLLPGILESRVIHYGIDLSVYKPADVREARKVLGIPNDLIVVLFSANGIRNNIFKDYRTMRDAIALAAQKSRRRNLRFLALGEAAPRERIGKTEVHFIPYQRDPRQVARYYQAADLYIHAAKEEAWGRSITEALACGTPVVATAVGGIPEQIKEGETGFLVPEGDAEAMAIQIVHLVEKDGLRLQIGLKATEDVKRRFDLERHANDYLNWYSEIIERFKQRPSP